MPLHPKFPKVFVIITGILLVIVVSFCLSFLYRKILKELAFFRQLKTTSELKDENLQLRKIILQKELTNIEKKRLIQENSLLKEMLDLKENYPLELTAANIVNTTPWKWNRLISINKGSSDGIQKDSLVIDSKNNLVGRITTIKPRSSLIRLIQDPDFKVIVSCNTLKTIFVGSLFEGGKLLYVPYDTEINKGDIATLTNINGKDVYIKVGTVNYIYRKSDALTQTIFVKPFVNPAQINRVFVIKQ